MNISLVFASSGIWVDFVIITSLCYKIYVSLGACLLSFFKANYSVPALHIIRYKVKLSFLLNLM